MSYAQYLETPHWQRLRFLVLARMKRGSLFECEGCHRLTSARRVEVHHRVYDRIGKERLADLLGLCDKCHEKTHALLPTQQAEHTQRVELLQAQLAELGIPPEDLPPFTEVGISEARP